MSLFRKHLKILAILIVVFPATFFIAWSLFLKPAKRAERHLDFIHEAISEMHPAILESDAMEFSHWHQQGYLDAKALLKGVKSNEGIQDLLNFYLSGYQDSHLSGWLNHSPFSDLDIKNRYWAGWLLKANQSGYSVIYSVGGQDYPPYGARLVSCDGEAIDELLKNRYAPFIDRRWQILAARDKIAKALTRKNNVIPSVKECIFDVGDALRTYPVRWALLGNEDSDKIAKLSHPAYQLPSVREFQANRYWVTASDFSLNSEEAVNAMQIMLDDLYALENLEVVVIDLRANSGGSSYYGYAIINRLIHRDMESARYLRGKFNEIFQDADALYRASWKAYWSYHYTLANDVSLKDSNSPQSEYFQAFLTRMKKALDNKEPTFYQSEIGVISESEPEDASASWNSATKFVLLTDRRCVSACLDMIDAMKQIPGLLHLGEPTDADTAYTEIAEVQSSYLSETYNFIVPIKKWTRRFREDNQPYVPDVIYDGDMNDDQVLQGWVEDQIYKNL